MFGQDQFRKRIAEALKCRNEIRNAPEGAVDANKEQKLRSADELLEPIRFGGNLAIAAFFSADKDKKREENRGIFAGLMGEYLVSGLHRPNKE